MTGKVKCKALCALGVLFLLWGAVFAAYLALRVKLKWESSKILTCLSIPLLLVLVPFSMYLAENAVSGITNGCLEKKPLSKEEIYAGEEFFNFVHGVCVVCALCLCIACIFLAHYTNEDLKVGGIKCLVAEAVCAFCCLLLCFGALASMTASKACASAKPKTQVDYSDTLMLNTEGGRSCA
ncbi:hypothetical protein ACJZTR_00375 [Neorickettsia risticii]|nr:hypothetical protein [Neorickettsia risticii]